MTKGPSTYLNGHADQIISPTIKIGDRVRLLDDNGGFGEAGAEGVVVGDINEPEVRFDNGRDWYVEKDFANCELVDTPGKSSVMDTSPSTKETTMDDDETSRPRFMTAWMTDTVERVDPTGDAFMSLEDADNFAQTVLAKDGRHGQIAVFEIRSVHSARLQITREAA